MLYLIPNTITIANLLCGVTAILLGDLWISSILILFAAVLDLLDGLAARALNAVSSIGKELDSLCDMVSFGVAPAYLYFLVRPGDDHIYFIPSLVICACAALRLAKFNTLPPSKDFLGLASPASGLFITGLVLTIHWDHPILTPWLSIEAVYLIIGVTIGLLMIIPLPMFSLKSLSDRSDRIWVLLTGLAIIAIVIWDYQLILPLGILAYILLSVIRLMTRSQVSPNEN